MKEMTEKAKEGHRRRTNRYRRTHRKKYNEYMKIKMREYRGKSPVDEADFLSGTESW